MSDYRDKLKVDPKTTEPKEHLYNARYIMSEQFEKDIQNILENNLDDVSCDYKRVINELKQMPEEQYSLELLNKVKILFRGYQLFPEFDEIIRFAYMGYKKKGKIEINGFVYNQLEGIYWFDEEIKNEIISLLEKEYANRFEERD